MLSGIRDLPARPLGPLGGPRSEVNAMVEQLVC